MGGKRQRRNCGQNTLNGNNFTFNRERKKKEILARDGPESMNAVRNWAFLLNELQSHRGLLGYRVT